MLLLSIYEPMSSCILVHLSRFLHDVILSFAGFNVGVIRVSSTIGKDHDRRLGRLTCSWIKRTCVHLISPDPGHCIRIRQLIIHCYLALSCICICTFLINQDYQQLLLNFLTLRQAGRYHQLLLYNTWFLTCFWSTQCAGLNSGLIPRFVYRSLVTSGYFLPKPPWCPYCHPFYARVLPGSPSCLPARLLKAGFILWSLRIMTADINWGQSPQHITVSIRSLLPSSWSCFIFI